MAVKQFRSANEAIHIGKCCANISSWCSRTKACSDGPPKLLVYLQVAAIVNEDTLARAVAVVCVEVCELVAGWAAGKMLVLPANGRGVAGATASAVICLPSSDSSPVNALPTVSGSIASNWSLLTCIG